MHALKLKTGTAALLALVVATPAMAFPDKPIELVVPFSPGGGSDVSARVFAQCIEQPDRRKGSGEKHHRRTR